MYRAMGIIMSRERKLLKKALKYVGLSSNDLAEDLYDEIDQLLAQPEQEPVTNEPTTTSMAVMPNGVRVSNVYDAYEEGRKSVMVEQEPVAWMNEDFEFYLDEEIYNGYLIPVYTSPFTQEIELLAQPEQEPDYYLWHGEVHEEHPTNEGDPDVYPLYLTPPKREPLSDEEIDVWCQYNNIRALEKLRFQQGVLFAEREHKIGVE